MFQSVSPQTELVCVADGLLEQMGLQAAPYQQPAPDNGHSSGSARRFATKQSPQVINSPVLGHNVDLYGLEERLSRVAGRSAPCWATVSQRITKAGREIRAPPPTSSRVCHGLDLLPPAPQLPPLV